MPITVLCNQCLRPIVGEVPVADNGLYFHAQCWVRHQKEVRDEANPKVRVLGFVRAVPVRVRREVPKPTDYG